MFLKKIILPWPTFDPAGSQLHATWWRSSSFFKCPLEGRANLAQHISFNVVKTIINHPPVITIFAGSIKPFPVMCGLRHCFNHIWGFWPCHSREPPAGRAATPTSCCQGPCSIGTGAATGEHAEIQLGDHPRICTRYHTLWGPCRYPLGRIWRLFR